MLNITIETHRKYNVFNKLTMYYYILNTYCDEGKL